jgi:hypothetical protein
MSKRTYWTTRTVLLILAAVSPWISLHPKAAAAATDEQMQNLALGPYVVIGWNDLGMHCMNKNFADLAVLPPFNTFWSTVIKRGDSTHLPQVMGSPYSVSYRIEDNTYSVGKTDFWSYETALFGVSLPDNVGLAGFGLTGQMAWNTDHFQATGVPVTPWTDADLVHEQPFQLGWLDAKDGNNNVVASTEIVVPVSTEMTCNACHHPNAGETVEHAILRLHDSEEGTHLVNSRPVLCANCHGSNALGMPGNPNLPSLSLAMHEQHGEVTNDCYKCHPGPNTQCLRDVMSQHYGMTCQSCHGNTANVAYTIEHGRQPWLQEPRCGDCHGPNYSEQTNTLFRNSKGHGGLYCETCHSSPHAILPSREERDNRQNVNLQGFAGTLKDCKVCHGITPPSGGPHGYWPTDAADVSATGLLLTASPNPLRANTEIRYRVLDGSPVRLAVFDAGGRAVRTLTRNVQSPGEHTLVWNGNDDLGRPVASGVYYCKLETGGKSAKAKIVKLDR